MIKRALIGSEMLVLGVAALPKTVIPIVLKESRKFAIAICSLLEGDSVLGLIAKVQL